MSKQMASKLDKRRRDDQPNNFFDDGVASMLRPYFFVFLHQRDESLIKEMNSLLRSFISK